mmetsp:Transcript_1687/g.2560  ORF Transcript_1687/g.2560 Transcript_1687/m.2560 type:complete len:372 (-) Transcript_1687:930-2045(-)
MVLQEEFIGIFAAFFAAVCFGSYGVPMKDEAATRVDVDPLVFQSYKAFTVLATSTLLIWVNNIMADDVNNDYHTFHKWHLLSDFTPWAFLSAVLWVPGGTAGVYAVRRAGLAISVGIWSCVIVIVSFFWGVLIFDEKQKTGPLGAFKAVSVLCLGLCGITYFSRREDKDEKKLKYNRSFGAVANETVPLKIGNDKKTKGGEGSTDIENQVLHLYLPPFLSNRKAINISKYQLGILMAVVNGLLAATIMVPLHYAPPNTTQGIGYSMSFGIAAVIVVIIIWMLRWIFCSIQHSSLAEGFSSLPSFHIQEMWQPGLLAGLLYSFGNLFGIVSIQKLGDFMGYSLNQSSMMISGELVEMNMIKEAFTTRPDGRT